VADELLWQSEDEREAAMAAEVEARRQDGDLAAVLGTPEGWRFVLRLLRRWGAEGPVQPGGEALRNEAEYLLADAARANPKACISLIAALRDIIL